MKKVRSNSVMPPWAALEEGRVPVDGETFSKESFEAEDDFVYYFDPNDKRYRCCCQQSHSTTGVRIIAGMLCITVLLELCQLCWQSMSDNPISATASDDTLLVQIVIGTVIAASVLLALWRENAAFLLPYLLLQVIGLVAVLVILFAMIYITLSDDINTISAFLTSHSPNVVITYNQNYLIYMGWTMIGSCIVLVVLQWWLISIVFACWRYFRDKSNFGYAKGYNTSSFVIFRRVECAKKESVNGDHDPYHKNVVRHMRFDVSRTKLRRFERSKSLDFHSNRTHGQTGHQIVYTDNATRIQSII